MRRHSRSRAGGLLLSCFVAAGIVAPVAHQVWHHPGHVHGRTERTPPDVHSHPRRHDRAPGSRPARDYNPARHSHDRGVPVREAHDHSPPGHHSDSDHGQGSISHFALAMLGAPPAPAVAGPAEILAPPPSRSYESLRGRVIRPRSPRAPPS